MLVARREIGAAIKRFALWGEKSRKGPSTLAADGLHRRLIAAVDVRTFVTVDLDGDKMLVDQRRDLRVLVGFAVHHVAPMAPYGPAIEQDRLVFPLGLFKGLLPPFMPVNRLVHRRTQIRRRGPRKRVEGFVAHQD